MSQPLSEANLSMLDALVTAVQAAGSYNRNDQQAPVVVLWPDKERQWEGLLPQLRARLPLLTFDATRYAPSERRGPAYWVRCMLAGTLPADQWPPAGVPILYLPGVGKSDLRGVEECPKPLQPLAELQFRGALWTQRNGKDWTVTAFLQSQDSGLGIEVAADQASKTALLRALPWLAAEAVATLRKAAPLRAAYFDELLNPDEVRRLLLWLNDPTAVQNHSDPATWQAFCSLCQHKYSFHPITDGPISAASKLGQPYGVWHPVWQRFSEAPEAYPNLPALLRQARPVIQLSLFENPEPYWPQDNESAESTLRQQLIVLHNALPEAALTTLATLEKQHGERRSWVWAKQGETALANALAYLLQLATHSQQPLAGATLAALAEAYTHWGWQVDAAAVAALASVTRSADVAAVKGVIRTLYAPWLAAGAGTFQQAVNHSPASSYMVAPPPLGQPGVCLVFCDALRFDAAQQLGQILQASGNSVQAAWRLAALPTVTPTAKPAVSPVWQQLIGAGETELAPRARVTQSRVNITVLRSLLSEAGYQTLQGDNLGDVQGMAWMEFGAIDQYGHQHGWQIVYHLAHEIQRLAERIQALLEHGWHSVQVITDHGWLLLPGGLPKVELPKHLTHVRKGRCAVLKADATTDQLTVRWFWDEATQVAVAPGIGCYEEGKEYEHGGISPQECVIPVLTVSARQPTRHLAEITEVTWKRQRCYIQIRGASSGLMVDVRRKPGDATSSIVAAPKGLEADGLVSLLVTDEELAGQSVAVVLLTSDGTLLAQQMTTVGG